MTRKKIGVLTSSRADYGIYSPLLMHWQNQKWITLERIIFGAHLLKDMSESLRKIKKDTYGEYEIVGDFSKTNLPEEVAEMYGKIVNYFSDFWKNHQYDLVVALGDRFEMSAAVQSSIPFNLTLAHLHGGETTLGAIDNIYRHQISLVAKLHFTSTASHKQRVIDITTDENTVHNVGSLSLSGLNLDSVKPWTHVAEQLGIISDSFILVTIHPETSNNKIFDQELSELSIAFDVLMRDYNILITGTNSDQNHQPIDVFFHQFAEKYPSRVNLVSSLGKENYFSALKHCRFVLGNSSSGIIEAASFKKFVINLGERQLGRHCNDNTFTLPYEAKKILDATEKIKVSNYKYLGENIYYQENVPEKITEIVKQYLENE